MITLYNEKDEKLKLISVFEFNDADMGESSISATVSFDKEQDFHPDWYVVYNGEKFYLGVRKPTGKKDTSSLSTAYTLVFKSEREDLKRYTFMDFVELGTGNPQPSSYNVPLYATLSEFVDRFNLNLRHYMGSRWQMVLPADYVEDGNAVSVVFDNASLWDVLLRVHEIFGVRWTIRSAGDILQIQVGFQEVEIEHVFEYGKDNGLVSVERNNALERIITRLRGRGSERNLPADYFHTGDPDTNSFLQATYFKNLMPKAYRDYIRGYNAGSGTGSWAYNQGVSDRVSGRDISPVDYAISDKEDLWGVSYGAIEPNDQIYPTLQGATRNGIRLDEVLAVEQVLVDGVREPQNIIAVGIGAGGQESSSGKCGNSQKNGYLADCRGGIDFTILTDRFPVANPINTAQVRITLTPSYISSEGLPVPVEFGPTSTVRSSAELQLVDFASSATGEIIRTQTITDTDTYLWELDNIPAGDYRFRANVTWSADIPANDREVVVNIDTRLTGATVKEYARETDKGEFEETFDIEIRDVWGIARNTGESDEDYTYRVWEPRAVSEDVAVMFSDGLLAGEDYEFRIVGFNSDANDLRQTIITAIKPTETGWKLTLQKSDAELEAGNIYLPNTMQNAKAGDHFFFVNVSMPYDPYVYDAEERLQAYLDSQLSLRDEEFPSFTITPSKIFCSSFPEVDKIQAGAKIRVRNTALVGDSYISLYIQSLTKRYSAGSLNPEWSLTISDLVVASGNPVETLQGEVDVLSQRFYNNRSAIQEAVRSLSSTFLRKDGIADVSYSPTEFRKQVKLGEGISDRGFINGDISGKGFGVYTDGDGNRVIEADVLVGRIGARFNEVVINQVTYSAGKQVFSSAGMVVSKVEDVGASWRCYFDTKNATVRNYFALNDGAFCQRFVDSGPRQYWARVTAVGSDYIEVSKTDRMQGSFDPIVGDNIAQLGNKTDKSRQAALMIDETRDGGGLVTWYDDITDFTLSVKDSVNIGRIDGKTWLQVYGSAFIGNKDKSQFVEFDNKTLKLKGRLEVGSTISDAMTVVEDGLIQSTLLKLGYYKDDVFKIMSGTNGLYDENALGGGIAAWYGGPMADREADSSLIEYAQSLFRFDGSGYLAGGNITWDKDGAGSVAGGDIKWDKDGAITLGVGIKISGEANETLGTILNLVNKIASWFGEDEDTGAIYVKKKDGEARDFYTYGAISFGGLGESSGSTGGGGITAITKEMIIQALEYTPYDAANPKGYITSSSIPAALPNPHKLTVNGVEYDGSAPVEIQIKAGVDDAQLADYAKKEWVEQQGYLTELLAQSTYQPKGNYVTESALNNKGYLTQSEAEETYQPLGDYALSDDLKSYLTKSSAKDTYATIVALNAAIADHDALREDFDALNTLINANASEYIDTWNEVKNFLDGYSDSDDLATILAGMNDDIAKRAKQTDLTGAVTRIDTLESTLETEQSYIDVLQGYFTSGKANRAIADGNGNNIVDTYATKVALSTTNSNLTALSKEFSEFKELINSLWYLDPDHANTVRTKLNVVVEQAISFGGYGESDGTSGVGGLTSFKVKVGSTTYTSVGDTVSIPAYPVIPTKISTFTNDANYAYKTDIPSLDNYATKGTTLAHYGITNAYTKSESNAQFFGLNLDRIHTATTSLNQAGYGYAADGWMGSGPAIALGSSNGYTMYLQQAASTYSLYVNYRSNGGSLQTEWKKIAFITDNVASATKAFDADKLGGQLPAYYATASALSTLQDSHNALSTKINTFLDSENLNGTIDRWKEVESFLLGYTDQQTLAELLNAKADKKDITDLDEIRNKVAKLSSWFGEDESTGAIFVQKKDGVARDFYTYGAISFGGYGESNGSNGGLTQVTVKLGNTEYTSVGGVVSLPAYPTSLPASDVYAWAKASTKPTYTFSEITGKPTTLNGYGITDAYTKTQVDNKLVNYLTTNTAQTVLASGAKIFKGAYGENIYIGGTKNGISIDINAANGGFARAISFINLADSFSNYVQFGAQGNSGSGIQNAFISVGEQDYNNAILNIYTDRIAVAGAASFSGLTTHSVGLKIGTTNVTEKTQNSIKYVEIDGNLVVTGAISFGGFGESSGTGGGITSVTKDMVIDALGYTPYNATNPNGYITNTALNGYATQSWVENKKYLTSITSLMITTALGFTPYNAASFTKANIKSTLGIYDWALAASKPTYTKSDVGLGNVTNLAASGYLTDLSSNSTNAISVTVGGTTKNISASTLKTSLGLGSLAYKSSLVASDIPGLSWSKITSGKPTTLSGYGITDALGINGTAADSNKLGGEAASAYAKFAGEIFNGDYKHIGYSYARNIEHTGPVIAFGASASYYAQIAAEGGFLYFRQYYEDHWLNGGWGQLAFITSNIASATKLKNSRTIWGQSFDGTSNVTGYLNSILNPIYPTSDVLAVNIEAVVATLNYAHIYVSNKTGTLNRPLVLQYGYGDVGIGVEQPSYKLDVQGVTRISDSNGSGVVIANQGNTIDGYYNGISGNLYLNNYSAGNVYLVTGGGNVGIGTNTPTSKLHIAGDITLSDTTGSASKSYKLKFLRRTTTDDYWDFGMYAQSTKGLTFYQSANSVDTDIAYLTGEGNFVVNGSITFGSASDRRLKDNIKSMTDKQAVSVLKALNPVTFKWNSTAYELGKLSGASDGFIADEYERLIPNSGRDIWANYRAINYERVSGYLVKGWQNHEFRITKVERMEERLQKAESRIKELENELKHRRN